MAIMTVTTRINYRYLVRKRKTDLWAMFLSHMKWDEIKNKSKDEIITLINKELDKADA